jgi:flavin-dependent dehydrogenase
VGSAGLTDVAVVGAGPAGTAAAATARAAGLDVDLYTAGPSNRMRAGESLPPGTDRVLEEIFGGDGFRPERHRPAYGNRSRWGGEALESADFMFNPFGSGWHLDRRAFDEALLDAVRRRGVRIVRKRVNRAADAPARLVIDATGRTARIARSCGAQRRRLDRLVAVIWMLETERDDHDSTTTVTAVENGWWYATPLPDRKRIAAFLTDADLLPPKPALPVELDGYRVTGPSQVTDAATSHLDAIAGQGWLAVGDAAVAFDPLSSQGILTAALMGREAGRVAACPERLGEFAKSYAELLREHLALRASYYELEGRWPRSTFWARRTRLRS